MGMGIGRLMVWLGEERGEPAPCVCKTFQGLNRGYARACLLSWSPIPQLKGIVLFVDQLGNVNFARRNKPKSVVSWQQGFSVEKQ